MATPTRAEAAARRRSAACTSGRRRSSAAVSPIGKARAYGWISTGREFCIERTRSLTEEHREPVHQLLLQCLEWRYRGFGGLQARPCPLDVKFVRPTAVVAHARQALGLCLADEVAPRHVQPGLRTAQFEVVARDLSRNAHFCASEVRLLLAEIGARRLHRAAHMTEQVKLPLCIKPHRVAFDRNACCPEPRLLRVPLRISGGQRDVGREVILGLLKSARAALTRVAATRRSRLAPSARVTRRLSSGSANSCHHAVSGSLG